MRRLNWLVLLLVPLFTMTIAFSEERTLLSLDAFWNTGELEEAIPEEGKDLLAEWGVDGFSEESLLSLTPEQFLQTVIEQLKSGIGAPARILGLLLGAAVLMALVAGIQGVADTSTLRPVYGMAAVLCVTASVGPRALLCLRDSSEVLQAASGFLSAYIPILTGILLTSGRSATAVVYNSMMFLGCEAAVLLMTTVFLPVTGILMALSAIAAASGENRLGAMVKMLRQLATWALGLLLVVFIGLTMLQTSVSAAADTVGAKSAKYLIGSLIPVVGSSISDAVMAARGALALLHSTVGGIGIVVLAAIFLPPVVQVLLWYGTFRFGGFLCGILDCSALADLSDGMASAFALMLSLLLAFLVMTIVCTAMILSMGGVS